MLNNFLNKININTTNIDNIILLIANTKSVPIGTCIYAIINLNLLGKQLKLTKKYCLIL